MVYWKMKRVAKQKYTTRHSKAKRAEPTLEGGGGSREVAKGEYWLEKRGEEPVLEWKQESIKVKIGTAVRIYQWAESVRVFTER